MPWRAPAAAGRWTALCAPHHWRLVVHLAGAAARLIHPVISKWYQPIIRPQRRGTMSWNCVRVTDVTGTTIDLYGHWDEPRPYTPRGVPALFCLVGLVRRHERPTKEFLMKPPMARFIFAAA